MSNLNTLSNLNTMNEKKVPAIATNLDTEGKVLSLVFSHGKVIKVSLSSLNEDILLQATLHGLKQKLGDAAAIARDTVTGKTASIDTKFDAVNEVYERLLNGEWNKAREGGSNDGGLLVQALCSMYTDKTVEEIKTYLEPLSNAQKAALRVAPEVAKAIHRIQASKVSKDLDAKSLLSGLGELPKKATKKAAS